MKGVSSISALQQLIHNIKYNYKWIKYMTFLKYENLFITMVKRHRDMLVQLS